MSKWTRAHAHDLADTAMKAGLTPEDATSAVEIGARMLAHGFMPAELDAMIRRQYEQRAEDGRAMMDGTATLSQVSRHLRRQVGEQR